MAETINARWIVRKLYQRTASPFWYGHVRDDRTGKVHWISTGETSQRRAKQRVLDRIRELEARENQEALPGVRFADGFETWLKLKTCPMPLSKRDPPVITKRDPPGRAILPRADRVAFLGKEPAGFAGGC